WYRWRWRALAYTGFRPRRYRRDTDWRWYWSMRGSWPVCRGAEKTDRLDCKWIQRLHSCGLLRGSFRPKEQINMLRTLVRDKGTLVAERADWIRRMQKSLDQMNVRV